MIRSLAVFLWLSLTGSAAHGDTGDSPFLYVLGITQDAGFPQAQCYQDHCLRAWRDASLRRLASSVALVDPETRSSYLFDATPDIRQQLYDLQSVAPASRFSLGGVFITHAHIGHYTGLMHFGQEASGATGLPVYVMPRMQHFLQNNGPWDQLVRYRNIALMPLDAEQPVSLSSTISVTPLLVPHRDEYSETVGFLIRGPSRKALFIPDIDKWSRWQDNIVQHIRAVDYALLDATFFADGELPGRSMADIPHPFVVQSMRLFASLSAEEKSRVYFIHFNHTNPLLNEASEERRQVQEAGFSIAAQGLRLPL